MSKITFRADDNLVNAVEHLEESKSEVMRDALRAYLEAHAPAAVPGAVDGVVADQVDGQVGDRLGGRVTPTRDVNVRLTVETDDDANAAVQRASAEEVDRHGGETPEETCTECGATLDDDHAYCPSCGEQATDRVFCECGDEIQSGWAFCPHCGRRTPAAETTER